MNKNMEVVDMDLKLATTVSIFSLKEGGFQRPLRKERLVEISEKLGNGIICPPITIAQIQGKNYLIDGQHRFAAWRTKNFPMKACIVKMGNMAQATESFIAMNREQIKVSLAHILKVSNDEYAKRVREFAKHCKVTIPHIHNLMCGIMNAKNPLKVEVPESQWKVAAKVMSYWMADRRWGREGNVWSSCGVLKLAGYFAGKSTAVDAILKDLGSLDYSKNSAMGRLSGTSWTCHKEMKQIVYKALAEKII